MRILARPRALRRAGRRAARRFLAAMAVVTVCFLALVIIFRILGLFAK